jgi:capsule polysaccharide export protein KpsE/RkpR
VTSNIILQRIIKAKYYIDGDSIDLYEYMRIESDTTEKDWQLKRDFLVQKFFKSSMLFFTQNQTNSLITLGISSTDGELSRQVLVKLLNEITKYFDSYYLERYREEKRHVEMTIDRTYEQLAKIEKKLTDFYRENSVIDAKSMAKVKEEKLLREKNILSQILMEMKTKKESIEFQIISNQNKLNIIDRPEKPVLPYKPNKRMLLISLNIFYLGVLLFIAIFKNQIIAAIKNLINI